MTLHDGTEEFLADAWLVHRGTGAGRDQTSGARAVPPVRQFARLHRQAALRHQLGNRYRLLQVRLRQGAVASDHNGEQCSLDAFAQCGSGKTLRQLVMDRAKRGLEGVIGIPEQVAGRPIEVNEEVKGDGFLINSPFQKVNRRYVNEVCEGLVPALQRRSVVRTEYTKSTLREMLREF